MTDGKQEKQQNHSVGTTKQTRNNQKHCLIQIGWKSIVTGIQATKMRNVLPEELCRCWQTQLPGRRVAKVKYITDQSTFEKNTSTHGINTEQTTYAVVLLDKLKTESCKHRNSPASQCLVDNVGRHIREGTGYA